MQPAAERDDRRASQGAQRGCGSTAIAGKRYQSRVTKLCGMVREFAEAYL